MGNKSKKTCRSKSGIAVADVRGQIGLSEQSDATLGFADRDMRAKCAEIAARLAFKPTDLTSIIRDAQKLFDWITTGNLRAPRTLNDEEPIEPHSGEGADIAPSKGESPESKWPPMPAVSTLDKVVQQIVRNARGDDGRT